MSECSSDIAHSLLAILEQSILNIRHYAETNRSDLCFIESNHIHNIPHLIGEFSRGMLEFYLSVEVPEYKRLTKNKIPKEFETQWRLLEDWLTQN